MCERPCDGALAANQLIMAKHWEEAEFCWGAGASWAETRCPRGPAPSRQGHQGAGARAPAALLLPAHASRVIPEIH